MDLSKCFDSLWTEERTNDLVGKDDKDALNDQCRGTIQNDELSMEK